MSRTCPRPANAITILLLVLIGAGCNDGPASLTHPQQPTAPGQPQYAVTIKPASSTLGAGESVGLDATVSGAQNTAVYWKLQEPDGGTVLPTIGASGHATYFAPDRFGTFHLVATSVAAPAESAVVTITVAAPQPAGPFQGAGSMKMARAWHTATRLQDGRVLITGGADAGGGTIAAAEIYDPATGTSRFTSGQMTTPRALHIATLLGDGRVLIAGTDDPTCAFSCEDLSAEIYDPGTDRFVATGSMLFPAGSPMLLASGKVLFIGYSAQIPDPAGDQYINTGPGQTYAAEVYDPATEQFTLAGASEHFAFPEAVLLRNGTVLIGDLGGDPASYAHAQFTTFDPRSGAYTTTSTAQEPYLDPTMGHSMTVLQNGRVLLVSGGGQGSGPAAGLYDPSTRAVTPTGSTSADEDHGLAFTATLLADGEVLLAGGVHQPGRNAAILASAHVYDPARGAFTAIGSMTRARYGHTATLLSDGRVLIAGGTVGGTTSATAELYLPNAPAALSPTALRAGATGDKRSVP